MARTESICKLTFEDGKVRQEVKNGYATADGGLLVCKSGKSWLVVDKGTGLYIGNGFKTMREAVASITDELAKKVAEYRETHRYRGAVRANELVRERGTMPKDEYLLYRERFSEEELDKLGEQEGEKEGADMAEKEAKAIAEKIEKATGEKVEVKVESFTTGKKGADMAKEPMSLKGEHVCITGTLAGMTRSEAFTRLKLLGGVPCEKFSGKVTMFVVAANAGKAKCEQAERAAEKGQAVKVVDGHEFAEALKAESDKVLAERAAAKKAEREREIAEAKAKLAAREQAKPSAPKAPAKPKDMKEEAMDMAKRIEKLEARLKEMSAELEATWKENELLKRKPVEVKAPAETAETAGAAEAVSLAAMQAWCEDKGLVASQKREGTCIWVEGESKPYADELKEMGFRFAKKRKSWYAKTA